LKDTTTAADNSDVDESTTWRANRNKSSWSGRGGCTVDYTVSATEWNKLLSGALDDNRLLFGLALLCLFYIVCINDNANHSNADKEEDGFARNCTCNPRYQHFS